MLSGVLESCLLVTRPDLPPTSGLVYMKHAFDSFPLHCELRDTGRSLAGGWVELGVGGSGCWWNWGLVEWSQGFKHQVKVNP